MLGEDHRKDFSVYPIINTKATEGFQARLLVGSGAIAYEQLFKEAGCDREGTVPWMETEELVRNSISMFLP